MTDRDETKTPINLPVHFNEGTQQLCDVDGGCIVDALDMHYDDPDEAVKILRYIGQRINAGYDAGRSAREPIDVVLFCPKCKTQHIDKAEPDVCESCGITEANHYLSGIESRSCPSFKAWLNPPHKSHRCGSCNTVFRPADVPTNGVEKAQTVGSNDTEEERA